MSKAEELAEFLDGLDIEPAHSNSKLDEAAALLREQDAKLYQYEEVMRQALEVCLEMRRSGDTRTVALAIRTEAAINKALPK